jgi:uncharacterized protein (TIGR02996 family)
MTNERALLAAVLSDPDCDATRLVYADALEESGDAERAQFIRSQVREGHALECMGDASVGQECPYRRGLCPNCEAAVRFGLPPQLAGENGYRFRRGFVYFIRAPLETLYGRETEDGIDGRGILPVVAASNPVAYVSVSNRWPRFVSDSLGSGWAWSFSSPVAGNRLPPLLRQRIAERYPHKINARGYLRFATREEIERALSDTLLEWAGQRQQPLEVSP